MPLGGMLDIDCDPGRVSKLLLAALLNISLGNCSATGFFFEVYPLMILWKSLPEACFECKPVLTPPFWPTTRALVANWELMFFWNELLK